LTLGEASFLAQFALNSASISHRNRFVEASRGAFCRPRFDGIERLKTEINTTIFPLTSDFIAPGQLADCPGAATSQA